MYDLIIIGAGPAGLAAGVYAARKKLDTLLVSKNIGGQMNLSPGIENYMGFQFIEGYELIDKFHSQMERFPIEQKIGTAIIEVMQPDGSFTIRTENGDNHQSRTVIVAAGKRAKTLDVPGEKDFIGKGVSYCATCDGPLFAQKRVVVIGGGNSALEVALDMSKIAEHVDLVSLTSLTGDPVLIERLTASNLRVLTGYNVERINGNRLVEGMVISNKKLGTSEVLEVDGIFVETGLVPNSEPVRGLVDTNGVGEIMVTCANETNVSGVYAAGDVTNVPEKQILVAAGEGAKAALQVNRYLQRLSSG